LCGAAQASFRAAAGLDAGRRTMACGGEQENPGCFRLYAGWVKQGQKEGFEGDKIEHDGGLLFTQRREYGIVNSLFSVHCVCRQVPGPPEKRCRRSRGDFFMMRLFLVLMCAMVLFSGCRKQGGAVSDSGKTQEAAVSNKIYQASVEKTKVIHEIINVRREMIRIETRLKMTLKDPSDKAALKEACIADAQWTKLSNELKALQEKTREAHAKLAAVFAEQDQLLSTNRLQQIPVKDAK